MKRGLSLVPTLLLTVFLTSPLKLLKRTSQYGPLFSRCSLIPKPHTFWFGCLRCQRNHNVEGHQWHFCEQIQCLFSSGRSSIFLNHVSLCPTSYSGNSLLLWDSWYGALLVPQSLIAVSDCYFYVSFACLFKSTSYVYMLCIYYPELQRAKYVIIAILQMKRQRLKEFK